MTMTDRPDLDHASEADLYDDDLADTRAPDAPADEPAEVPRLDTGQALALVSDAEAASVSLFPERAELEALAGLAVTLSASGLVPEALRQKPNDVLVVLLTARELRIDYMTALRECAPVKGKVTISPKLRIALVIDRGLGDIWFDPTNNAATATVYGQRAGDERVHAYTFTWDDAQAAGLADKRCRPNATGTAIEHWEATSGSQRDRTCGCEMYRKYGRNMLKWRASGYLIDEVFPHASTGLYSPEDLGAQVDEDGRAVLDVGSAEALPGMKRGGRGQQAAAGDLEEAPISAEDLADLQRRIPALPEAGVAVLRELWQRSLPKPEHLLARQVKTARAMVESVEKRAEKGEWGEWSNWTSGGQEPAQRPQPEDFEAGSGKSPHELARERRAREAREQVEAEAAAAREARQEAGDEPAAASTRQDPPEAGSGDETAGSEFLEAAYGDRCVGCGGEFARTASGKPSQGGKGRDQNRPDYHRECAPFD